MRRGLSLSWLLAVTAAAQPQVAAEAPRVAGEERVHLSLIAGPSFHTSKALETQLTTGYSGATPPAVELFGAAWFLPWLGVSLEGAAEWFSVGGDGFDGQPTGRVPVAGYRGQLALAGRLRPGAGFALELSLGYALGLLPSVSAADGPLVSRPMFHHGPLLAAAVGLDRGWPVSARLRGAVAPFGWGSSEPSGPTTVGWYAMGAEVNVGRLSLVGAQWSAVLDYELRIADAAAPAQRYRLEQLGHRFGLGLRARFFPERAAGGEVAAAPREGSLLGTVVSPEGQPIAGAEVEVEGRALTTDAAGQFKLEGLEARTVAVSARATDFKPAAATVAIAGGQQATVTVVLPRPSGPGVLVGTVKLKSPAGPAAGAQVALAGQPPVKAADDGSFRLEGAGPGPVSVTVTFPGYLPVEEAVQVPPESTATLEVLLENKKPMAKLRGRVVASEAGFKATVTVVEAKQKLTVSGDGRFTLELPGGAYKVVIEAPGYITQSRVVNLADGDETIYYFELRPALQ